MFTIWYKAINTFPFWQNETPLGQSQGSVLQRAALFIHIQQIARCHWHGPRDKVAETLTIDSRHQGHSVISHRDRGRSGWRCVCVPVGTVRTPPGGTWQGRRLWSQWEPLHGTTCQRESTKSKGSGLVTAGMQPFRYTLKADSHRDRDTALRCHKPFCHRKCDSLRSSEGQWWCV